MGAVQLPDELMLMIDRQVADIFLAANDTQEKFSANPHFVAVCQRILKREWELLKKEIAAAQ